MKKLLEKIGDLEWYKALLIWYVIMTGFIFGFYSLIGAGLKDPIVGTQEALLKISLMIAIPFSFLISLMNSQMKKSEAFWYRAKEVEKEIDDAETLQELNRIVAEEFSYETGVLRKMASGPPHYQKMREMYKVIETASKYLS
jgi:hypothetical protein